MLGRSSVSAPLIGQTGCFADNESVFTPADDLLRQEVRELTQLMREDATLADVRAVLAAHELQEDDVVLAGLIDSEDNSRYGVLVDGNAVATIFETAPDGAVTRWQRLDDPADASNDFQAVQAAVAMIRSGEVF